MSFDLKDSSKAKTTTIFVKESAWKEAAEIAQNNNAASIASYDLIYMNLITNDTKVTIDSFRHKKKYTIPCLFDSLSLIIEITE
ncbi:hypothetical protein F4703DRAFT_1895440 [Phycomyces blakesleeanus]